MNSNQSITSLICLMSSWGLGDCLNLTVLMKALENLDPRMWAASISNMLSPSAIKFVILSSSISLRVSKKASTFHFQQFFGYITSYLVRADIISTSLFSSQKTLGRNLFAESYTHPSAALVTIQVFPSFFAFYNSSRATRSSSSNLSAKAGGN